MRSPNIGSSNVLMSLYASAISLDIVSMLSKSDFRIARNCKFSSKVFPSWFSTCVEDHTHECIYYEIVWLSTKLSSMLSGVLFCYFEMFDSPLLVTYIVLMRVLFECIVSKDTSEDYFSCPSPNRLKTSELLPADTNLRTSNSSEICPVPTQQLCRSEHIQIQGIGVTSEIIGEFTTLKPGKIYKNRFANSSFSRTSILII